MYEKLKAILKATSLGRMLVDLVICMKSLKETDEDKFFKLSYEKRIDYIKNAYSAPYKKDYCGDFFDIPEHETKKMLRKTRRWFYDIMLGYAQVINPKSVLQLGGFTMIESQWLVFGGYKGRVIASDYSKDHLAHMQKVFETSSLKNLEYREIDIENPNLRDFEDVDMVATIAVLSNIQPEGMKKLYNVIKDSPVQCVVIGEMYVEESLSVDPKTAKS